MNEMGLEMHDMFRGQQDEAEGAAMVTIWSPFGHNDGREKQGRAHRISFQIAREICDVKETEDIYLGLKEPRDQ